MEYSLQKREKIRLVRAGAKVFLGGPDAIQDAEQMRRQVLDDVLATIRQSGLCLRLDAFVGVEFGRIGRKGLQVQTRGVAKEGANRFSFVDATVVPDDNDVSMKVAQEMTQESAQTSS